MVVIWWIVAFFSSVPAGQEAVTLSQSNLHNKLLPCILFT